MERWVTADEVFAAKARLEAEIAGWESPEAYALGVQIDGVIDWRVVNFPNWHQLPAVVLATVLGHRTGSATFWMSTAQLSAAIEMLAPAGFCKAFEHPNLWAWERIRAELDASELPRTARIVAVFLATADLPPVDQAQRQLQDRLRQA